MIKILYIAKKWGDPRDKDCTAEEWNEIFSRFPQSIRGKAANLAAHNWDVIQIDDKILVSCAWSGGYWFSSDGTQTLMTPEEICKFYPPIKKDENKYSLAFAYNSETRRYHNRVIKLEKENED